MEENCVICGKPLTKKGSFICEKCRAKGWIDCNVESAKKKKKTIERTDEVLKQLVQAE